MKKFFKFIDKLLSILLIIAVAGGIVYVWKINPDVIKPSYTVTLDSGGVEIPDKEFKVKKGKTIELPTLTRDGYSFDGWYLNDTKWSADMTINENSVLTAKWIPNKYTITFYIETNEYQISCDYDSIPTCPEEYLHKAKTAEYEYEFSGFTPELSKVTGPASYTASFTQKPRHFLINASTNLDNAGTFTYSTDITNGIEYGKDLSITASPNVGYEFLGFYTNGELTTTNLVISFNNITSDIYIEAKYKLISKEIIYNTEDATENPNPTSYNITMGNLKLKPASKSGYYFNGWFTKPSGNGTKIASINFESFSTNSSITLYAHFSQIVTINYNVDGTIIDTDSQLVGTILTPMNLDSAKYGMNGYTVNVWYTNSFFSTTYIDTTLTGPLTLYGKWEYMFDSGFGAYLEKFNTAKNSRTLTITSEDEMIKWVEYVTVCNITTSNKVDITFGSGYLVSGTSISELQSKVSDILSKVNYPNGIHISYSYLNTSTCTLTSIYNIDKSDTEGKLTIDKSKSGCLEQYCQITLTSGGNRSEDNTAFNIDKVTNTIEVSTSNGLVYALEHGLKPIPITGSSAENVYNKAKSILNRICNNEMSDFEKIKAIYDWLTSHVQYDHTALTIPDNQALNYDSWYAEGVLNNGKAVCDGISKALLIMAQIENIPCIRVSGTSNGSGHAWNKVYINNAWFVIDATHGDLSINNNYEQPTYSSFLVTDTYKSKNCNFDNSTPSANTSINVYEKMIYSSSLGKFDLYINDETEANKLLSYIKAYSPELNYYGATTTTTYATIEFVIANGATVSASYITSRLGLCYIVRTTLESGETAYSLKIPR